jgi:hypothetical protein
MRPLPYNRPMTEETATNSSDTIWPPPPGGADGSRYSFTLEDVDAARIGDRLILTCRGLRRAPAWTLMVAAAILNLEFVVTRSIYPGILYRIPPVPQSHLIAALAAVSPFLVLDGVLYFFWRLYTQRQDDGVFTLYRDSRTGAGFCEPLGEMSSVLRIRTTNRYWIGQPRYVLNIHYRGGLSRTNGRLPLNPKLLPLFITFRFRSRENAEHLAREIADVTGVELLSDDWAI